MKTRQIILRTIKMTKKRLGIYGCGIRIRPYETIDLRMHTCMAPFLSPKQLIGNEIKKLNFTFLNEQVQFNNKVDWTVPDKNRLWRYNLHYFDYLMAVGGLSQKTGLGLIEDWIVANPPGTPDAWDPFPVSLRIVNWIKYLSALEISDHVREKIGNSLYAQTLWLERNLEKDLLANHYFKNLKALVFSGLSFEDFRAAKWLTKGISGIEKELKEQVLADGGHFERSPMYHSMILQDCIDLINICDGNTKGAVAALAESLKPVTACMMRFLTGVTHPDGDISLFNDAAVGIEASPKELEGYYEAVMASRFPEESRVANSFSDAGYFIMNPRDGDKLIVDCGKIGPDYQPGHSHCDTLSFELSLKGRRIIVDSGCYGYEDGEIRQYNRGNIGHNTVTIDGENQSEVWGSHRCARRAKPLYGRLFEKDNALIFEGAHDGYRRLKGQPIHHRKISWMNDQINIEDTIDGKEEHDIELRLHINPDLELSISGEEAIIRDGKHLIARIHFFQDCNIAVHNGWYCPEFGKKLACSVLVSSFKQVQIPFKTGWTIFIF